MMHESHLLVLLRDVRLLVGYTVLLHAITFTEVGSQDLIIKTRATNRWRLGILGDGGVVVSISLRGTGAAEFFS